MRTAMVAVIASLIVLPENRFTTDFTFDLTEGRAAYHAGPSGLTPGNGDLGSIPGT